jgi:hypothetical protein
MQAIRQTVTVPATRELHIKLPDEAAAHEEAEVIILFKSTSPAQDERLAAMRDAMSDELFIADLTETMKNFQHADRDERIA